MCTWYIAIFTLSYCGPTSLFRNARYSTANSNTVALSVLRVIPGTSSLSFSQEILIRALEQHGVSLFREREDERMMEQREEERGGEKQRDGNSFALSIIKNVLDDFLGIPFYIILETPFSWSHITNAQ